jgi:hypothetical protein
VNSQDTSVGVVALGGSAASVLLYLLGPALEALVGERPAPGVEAAIGTLLTAALAWVLPARLRR